MTTHLTYPIQIPFDGIGQTLYRCFLQVGEAILIPFLLGSRLPVLVLGCCVSGSQSVCDMGLTQGQIWI
jgi:hypothetical protein